MITAAQFREAKPDDATMPFQSPTEIDQHLAARLKLVRKKYGFTQQDFAQLLDLTVQSYSTMETGVKMLRVRNLMILSIRFDIPFIEFVPELPDELMKEIRES